jgi:hypothetical protein
MDLHTTRPSTLINKITILFATILIGIFVMIIITAWLTQYIGLLAVVGAVPYILYARWALNKISQYDWYLEIIQREKRRIWG